MIDIDKIEEAAKRHGNDADWQGAAIAYETHVTPSVVLEMVNLIRLQEAGLNAEQARYESLSEAFASIPAQTGMIGITAAELSAMINWLENGCDPKEAAKELRLYGERAWTGLQPMQQPAPAHAVHQFRTAGASDWYDGHPDNEDGGGPYEVRILFAAPVAAPVDVPAASVQPKGEQPFLQAWPHAHRTEVASAFLASYSDVNKEKLLSYEVQPMIRELAALIGQWQQAAVNPYLADKCAYPDKRVQPDSGTAASVQPGFDMPLRKAVQQMTLALNENEWADLLTTDPDAEALEEAIRDVLETAGQLGDPQPDSGRDAALPAGYSATYADGHGWYIDPPEGSRWVAYDGTPAADLIAALSANPASVAQVGELSEAKPVAEVRLCREDNFYYAVVTDQSAVKPGDQLVLAAAKKGPKT